MGLNTAQARETAEKSEVPFDLKIPQSSLQQDLKMGTSGGYDHTPWLKSSEDWHGRPDFSMTIVRRSNRWFYPLPMIIWSVDDVFT